jgi:hypothetical protein
MKSFLDYDRFDLEQDIILLWGTAELAIKEVLNMRSQRLWDDFERMIETKQFVKPQETEK